MGMTPMDRDTVPANQARETSRSLKERAERLSKCLGGLTKSLDLPLLKICDVSPQLMEAVRRSAIGFLIDSILESGGGPIDFNASDFVSANGPLIAALPNKTPNGLVLPKLETSCSFSAFHRAVARLVASFGMDRHIHLIHLPVNLRFVSGKRDTVREQRPRATTKWHSDIWAGEATHALMVFVPVSGDFTNTSIDFCEPARFPADLMRPLEDFDLGSHLVEDGIRYQARLDGDRVAFTDPMLLHRTMAVGGGPRLSIDFRFFPHHLVSSDVITETSRNVNYIPLADWVAQGTDRAIVSRDSIHRRDYVDSVTNAYATPIQSVIL